MSNPDTSVLFRPLSIRSLELKNRIDDKACAGVLADMRKRLVRWQAETQDPDIVLEEAVEEEKT